MGRIRTIKPEFPQSESMGRCSRDARLLFIQLWTICDDAGRTRAASRMLASLLFPYDDDAPGLIDGWLGELEREGCLVRYMIDGQTYLQIHKWLTHQKIDKPSQSKTPEFVDGSRIVVEASRKIALDQGEDQGKEREQGEEGKGTLMCEPVVQEPAIVEQPLELPVALFPVIQSHQPPSPVVEVVTAEVWPTFDDWWNLYDKKQDRYWCEQKLWPKLDQETREKIMAHTKLYVAESFVNGEAIPARCNPKTYLNNRRYNESVIPKSSYANGKPKPISDAASIAATVAILEARLPIGPRAGAEEG